MARYTGGLPVPAHEIGDAVWRTAHARAIKTSEVVNGIITAAEVIGSKLLEPSMLQALQSERYRSILRHIADRPRMHFRRSDVLARLGGDDKSALDNFLRRMRKLGAIETDPGNPWRGIASRTVHALYSFMESHQHSRRRGGS